MKIFTRIPLTITASLLLLSSTVFGQFDTGVSDLRVSSTPNNTVPANFLSSIYFTLTNIGTALTTNETVVAGVIINGDTAFGPLSISGNIPSGTEINMPHDLVNQNNELITFFYEFDPAEPFHAICAFAFVEQGENNPANNFICRDTMFVNTSAANDWAADDLTLHEPSNIDGFDIDNYENTVPDLDSLTATFTNIGNMTYTQRTPLSYRIGLNGDTSDVTGFLANDLAPGESTTRVINNPAILPAVPQDSGTYALCAIANALGDQVSANNSSCDSFTIIDSYNPFAPGNWPTGQDEVEGESLNIIPTMDNVLITGVENSTIITVTDMQGRIIDMSEINKNGSINLEAQATGIYVIKATDQTTGETQMRKVSN